MVEKYRANIDVTVNGRKFLAGEEITEGMAPGDREFLLREDYIERIADPTQKAEKPGQAAKKGKPDKSGQLTEEAAGKGKPDKSGQSTEETAGKEKPHKSEDAREPRR